MVFNEVKGCHPWFCFKEVDRSNSQVDKMIDVTSKGFQAEKMHGTSVPEKGQNCLWIWTSPEENET